MPEICWVVTEGPQLAQGDYLPNIHVPLFRSPFNEPVPAHGAEAEGLTEVQARDMVVVSQTCDLELEKLRFVAMCPASTISDLEQEQPAMAKKWKEVQKGRHEGLLMLGPCGDPENHRNALIIDFREIVSLPRGYVESHASSLGRRYRLKSPFLEHLSQAFGRFYMRVALPEFINLP